MPGKKTAITYIDGFNLYHGMLNKGWGHYKWLDLNAFSESLVPAKHDLALTRYFTSRIKGDQAKHDRQVRYISALRAHLGNKLDVKYGSFQFFPSHCKHCGNKPVYCQNCANEYSKPNEKKTDVNIATYLLVDCIDKNTNCVVLIAGDTDYEPVLIELARLFPKVTRIVAFPPKRRNPKLFGLCDSWFDISEDSFSKCQLPNPVTSSKTGKLYHKPSVWPKIAI